MQYQSNELVNGTIEPEKSEINNEIDILHVRQVASRTILHVNKPIVIIQYPRKTSTYNVINKLVFM